MRCSVALGTNLRVKILNVTVTKVEVCLFVGLIDRELRVPLLGKKFLLTILFFWIFSSLTFGSTYSGHSAYAAISHHLLSLIKIHPPDIAIYQLDSVERLARVLKSETSLASAFIKRGNLLMKDNQLVAADSLFRMARGILINKKKNKQYLLLLKNLAICNYYLGNNSKVLDYTQEGIAVSRKLNNTLLRGTFNNILGIAMDGMGNRAKALKYYLQALDFFELLKDEEKIASVEMNIGVLFEEQKDLDKAEKYFWKTLFTAKHIKDTVLMSASYNNLANIYSARKEYKKALDYTLKSLALSRPKNDLFTVAMDLNNIGDAYGNLKDYSKAFDYYQQALRLARKIHSKRTISTSLSSLAEIYEKKQDIPQAIRFASESWKQVQNGGDVNEMLIALKQLQHLYAIKGDYKKAYGFMFRYVNLRDSVFSDQNESRLAKVQMDYAFRAKDLSLKYAKEKQKFLMAYFLISLFALLLAIGIAVFIIRLRVLKNRVLKNRVSFVDSLLEYSESFVLMLDKNLLVSYLSPSYQKAFGHYLNDKKRVNPLNSIHPDEADALREKLRRFFQGEEKRIEFYFRLKKNTGEYRYMQGVFNNHLHNPDLKSFVLNFWDITELRKTQQAISESEKKYYDIFNAFPDIYFRIDMDGIITEISPSVIQITGFDHQEVVGRLLYDFVELDMTWRNARKILYVLKHIKDYNLTLRTKNRKKIFCSLNIHGVKNSQGAVIGFEGVLRDISGRVEAEKQLQQSERDLKEANESKDKILSIIGHDLLGPIGTQKSILDMVIDEVEDFSREEILRLLQTMKPSLDATYTMIVNLLSWARIMRHSIKPSLKQNDLSLLVERSFDLLKQQAEQKKIKLIYLGDKKVLAIFDKNLMDIVIRNLLSNAIKFSNSDSEIYVAVVKRKDEVEVGVTDTGMGLSEGDIQKILNEKEKIESRLGTQKEKGTGLGLIVVKEFIQHNNGHLHIKSQPGKGTTFSFSLHVV